MSFASVHTWTMAHDHGTVTRPPGATNARRLGLAFVVIGIFFVVEVVAGVATGSLALLSDAGHMLTDVIGLGMALAAAQLAIAHERRSNPGQHTFGVYRLEILAAFVNSLLLVGVAVYVMAEAVERLRLDVPAEIDAGPVLVVATLGLLANIAAYLLLREGAATSVNVEAALLEVTADAIGSIGVIVSAVLLQIFGWQWVDPVFGAAIGVWILPRAWRLGRQTIRILLQAAPPDVDLVALHDELTALDGVIEVHDLHVWTLTSQMENASAHLVVAPTTDSHAVLDAARDVLEARHGIAHATLQIEPSDHRGCDEVGW